MKQAFFLLLLLSLASAASAGSHTGVINSIWSSPTSPYVMFDFTTPIEDTHRCNRSERFSLDTRTIGGHSTFETLLMAKARELVVAVEGLGTCNIHDAENVKSIRVY